MSAISQALGTERINVGSTASKQGTSWTGRYGRREAADTFLNNAELTAQECIAFEDWVSPTQAGDTAEGAQSTRLNAPATRQGQATNQDAQCVTVSAASVRSYDRGFLSTLNREGLRRALWYCRRQDSRPGEINPAAAQYDGLATSASVRAEYRRRGWKVPRLTQAER
jgi:hypothetical protein